MPGLPTLLVVFAPVMSTAYTPSAAVAGALA